MNKKIYIRTFGCQMNVRDSEFVMGILLDSGFSQAPSMEKADVILFNSCSVRKHAEDRLISNIADLEGLKRKRPHIAIGLMGCTAQSYGQKMLAKAPLLDFVCGPGNEADLARIIKDVFKDRCSIIALDKVDKKRPELFPKYRDSRFKAYVSISEGCDNFCSYCIVPYVRGRERSRDAKDIIREVNGLAARGFKEVTLLGQNVNSYGQTTNYKLQTTKFVELLEQLNKIRGIERIRFMTSHPKDASIDLFKAMRDLEKVCEHLHLPLQSGSDRILKLMNRRYTPAHYLKLIEQYRKLVPEGSVTTDIIVGFPAETERDFQKTARLMEEIGFDSAYMFKYSPRPQARSALLTDGVPPDVKQKRLEVILNLQCRMSRKRNEPMKGGQFEVLIDERNKKSPSLLNGRTRTNKIVIFEGTDELIGRFADVKIESVTPHTLRGRMTA